MHVESYDDAKAEPGGLVDQFFRVVGVSPPQGSTGVWERPGVYKGDAFGSPEARVAFLARYPKTIPY